MLDDYQLYSTFVGTNENFLLGDSGAGIDRMLIFGHL